MLSEGSQFLVSGNGLRSDDRSRCVWRDEAHRGPEQQAFYVNLTLPLPFMQTLGLPLRTRSPSTWLQTPVELVLLAQLTGPPSLCRTAPCAG